MNISPLQPKKKKETKTQRSGAISHLKNLELLWSHQTVWGDEWVMFSCSLAVILLTALEQVT